MQLLAIYGSPRKDGNTDLLLNQFLKGAEKAGCQINRLFVRDLTIYPCTACGKCEKEPICPLDDDMQMIYAALEKAEAVVVATPVYFYNVPAQLKALIDRCQLLWHKNKEKKPTKPGYLISVGGSKGKRLFDGVILTIKYFLNSTGFSLKESLTYANIDAKGAIKGHPTALKEAFVAGERLCQR